MRTHLSMRLAMPSLQLTTESPRNVAVRGRVALLVILLRHGQGNAADTDQTALGQRTNQSGLTIRISSANLAQSTAPHEDTTPAVSAVPFADGARATVVIGRANISVAGLAFHWVRFVFNHVVLGEGEGKTEKLKEVLRFISHLTSKKGGVRCIPPCPP